MPAPEMLAFRQMPAPASLEQRLATYGCTGIIRLDGGLSDPGQLDYLDLLPKEVGQTPKLTGVAEHQGTALLYLVDASGSVQSDLASLAVLRQQLANRSDPAWLGVVRSGSLEIFPIGFRATAEMKSVQVIEEHDEQAPFFFQSLIHGTFKQNKRLHGTDFVFRKIFDLLTMMTDKFVPPGGQGPFKDGLEVLSMAGRALFFRFLIDRGIVLEEDLHGDHGICPTATNLKDAFSTPDKAACTSAWLDATFNGDFLPLIDESLPAGDRQARTQEYLRYYTDVERRAGAEVFVYLFAILHGWSATGREVQTELDWNDFDFAHIPVGVLSQVYESFSHRADARLARDTSVHYTPRSVASLMVNEAFAATKDQKDVKVLDAACGAGIFLVLTFRRLVREQWQADGKRPDTAAIQAILYNQVRGFDISESALRLAALALYITAIELNASPRPPHLLMFPRKMRDQVLYLFDDEGGGQRSAFPLGSLGPKVPAEFNGYFDVVIGNPPWTRLRESKAEKAREQPVERASQRKATDKLNEEFTRIGRRVLRSIGSVGPANTYHNPDNNPDLPFLWRAAEWAKEGGVIALAMPARLFGRNSGRGLKAWRCVLRSVEVTGIINGADLRWSSVWRDVKAPFCVFFARNRRPRPDHRFYYAALVNEPAINKRGHFRIDYESVRSIEAAQLEKQSWLLKTLSLGTWLDAEVMSALTDHKVEPLQKRWRGWDSKANKTGEGYNRAPESKQYPAGFLTDMLVFEKPAAGYAIEYDKLRTYKQRYNADTANMCRRRELFQPPLVIVPKAQGADPQGRQAYLANKAVAFSKSFYGYSCAGSPDPQTLSSLIFLLAHSTLLRYFTLMVSVSVGADRMVLTKGDLDRCPFPDVRTLPEELRQQIQDLARRVQSEAEKPWHEVNKFMFSLYGLDASAVQVVEDTLFAAAAYRRKGQNSFAFTVPDTRNLFIETLRAGLEPYFDVCGQHVEVREVAVQSGQWVEPWAFLAVARSGEPTSVQPPLLLAAMKVANERGCSRIILHTPDENGLLLGLLNQRRWWTATRARLCAQQIIREQLGVFRLAEA